ncbi:exopolysaccharide biosynthesis protein [Alkalisalibacterium limincola]|uniref:Exopolysaccharide biosynthesis protein n=2 Tax=Alkalisalibacterium limincola TaxID=2699169 RepID=A0A5C8KMR0_9GAMM|nr:exopolysaccharide biosynthesis protein [Alkalisalibacterium limincola]
MITPLPMLSGHKGYGRQPASNMPSRITTKSLLDAIADTAPPGGVALGELLEEFRQRAFGLGILVASLPLFVPLPIGTGAISGPLIGLLGLQLMLLLTNPWLPGFVARHRIGHDSLQRMRTRLGPWLARLERVSHPRLQGLIHRGPASIFTGLMLVAVGILAALPIPFTNYPFGLLLALFAIALIEEDGALMLVAWVLSLVAIVASVMLSNELYQFLVGVFG